MHGQLSPLSASTLGDHTYRALKSAILCLDLAPSSILDEGLLAAQLAVSKTPVREALARLTGEGLVVSDGGRRTRVAQLSLQTIRDAYSVRLLLEPASIHQVARGQPLAALLVRLQELVERAADALARHDLDALVAANDEFHRVLLERNGNLCLRRIVEGLFDQVCRVRAAIFRSEERLAHHRISAAGIENHRRIIEALASGDADRAAWAMRNDIQLFLDTVTTAEMEVEFQRLGLVSRNTDARPRSRPDSPAAIGNRMSSI